MPITGLGTNSESLHGFFVVHLSIFLV